MCLMAVLWHLGGRLSSLSRASNWLLWLMIISTCLYKALCQATKTAMDHHYQVAVQLNNAVHQQTTAYNSTFQLIFNEFPKFFTPVADYPLGRLGSCLRPGKVRRPVISVWKKRVTSFAKVGFFRHYFRVCEKKSEKNILLKHFLHSFINSKHSVAFLCSMFLSA